MYKATKSACTSLYLSEHFYSNLLGSSHSATLSYDWKANTTKMKRKNNTEKHYIGKVSNKNNYWMKTTNVQSYKKRLYIVVFIRAFL